MTTYELIELAGQRIAEAAGSPARVILFGSAARGELTRDSDLDFLVIERDVENRVAEAVRLRDAVGRMPVDVIVMDEDLAERRGKVRGTMVHHALREGRIVARSNP
jgi:predicted nucleotidyltransferase